MEEKNGAWEADRGIRGNAQRDADSKPNAGDAVNEPGAGLGTPSGLIRDLAARAGEATTYRPDETLRSSPKHFTTEVIIGWRAWRLVSWKLWKAQYEVVLESIVYPMIWHPAKPVRGLVDLALPSGIHAWQTRQQCIAHTELYGSYSRDWVIGEVSLWGHVIKHEHGYRAEYAYPRRLIVPEYLRECGDIAAELRRTYGIECEWF